MKAATLLCGASAICLFAGCSSKPPGCGDSDTAEALQTTIIDALKAKYEKSIAQDDPDEILKKYYQKLKLEITNAATDGYDESAKKYSCRGNLKVTTGSGKTGSKDILYSTQRVENNPKASFVVNAANFNQFIYFVMEDAESHYDSNRWTGTWNGTVACAGIEDATSGALGPFKSAFTMTVNGQDVAAEMNVQGGYTEPLKGKITTVGGIVRILPQLRLYTGRTTNELENNPLYTSFTEGQITRDSAEASGSIAYKGIIQRACKLNLARGASPVSVDKNSINPTLYVEKKPTQPNEFSYVERIQIVGEPTFLGEGSGVALKTSKGTLTIYSYDINGTAEYLRNGACAQVSSNERVVYGESVDSGVKKIEACHN